MKYISKAKIHLKAFFDELKKKFKKNQKDISFWFSIVFFFIMMNLSSVIIFEQFIKKDSGDNSSYSASDSDSSESEEDSSCNVQGISIHGEIFTYNSPDSYNDQALLAYDQSSSEEAVWTVEKAQDKDNIKAILVEIDSPGGSPTAGEELAQAFKKSKKPVIAVIRGQGLSTAYMAATGAETIFASNFSDIGSIGVTMSYLQNTEKNKKAGLEYITLSSGKYKDAGNPDKAISNEEKAIFMRDVNNIFEGFVKIVAENRKLSEVNVKKIADGSGMLGQMALKSGLIDKIGTYQDAKKFVSEKIGEEASVCW